MLADDALSALFYVVLSTSQVTPNVLRIFKTEICLPFLTNVFIGVSVYQDRAKEAIVTRMINRSAGGLEPPVSLYTLADIACSLIYLIVYFVNYSLHDSKFV